MGCIIFTQCDSGLGCDTTPIHDEIWESLPVSVSATPDFESEFIFDTIEMFNRFSGIDAFQIDDENPQVTIGFGEVEDLGFLGATTTVTNQIDGFIQYGSIEIDADVSDDDLQTVLLHELGHALGKKTHDSDGLMYCYTIGSDYSDNEWNDIFGKMRAWISEIYPQ